MSARQELLLALADDALVLGHRHAQWTGVAPHLEEDLAFTSIGLDAMGHALIWYGLAAEFLAAESLAADPDALALGRSPQEFRSCALVERPNRDWAYTIARHWLADTAETARLEWLAASEWTALREAAGGPAREQAWHLRHAGEWMDRLAGGPAQARARLAEGLRLALPEAPGLFAPSYGEDALVGEGTLPSPSRAVLERWRAARAAELVGWGMGELTPLLEAAPGDRATRTEDFAELWAELTGLYQAHPGARW